MAVSNRDEFPMSVKRELAERAHYLCSMGREPTVGPSLTSTRSVRAGDAAHITAAAPGGPRHDPDITREQRRSAENGIWLCGTHADLVDRDADRYPTAYLRQMKAEHEQWVTAWLEGRQTHPSDASRPSLSALAIHDVRQVAWQLRGPGWDGLDAAFERLGPFAEPLQYGAEVRQEILLTVERVVGRMRGAVTAWSRPQATLDLLAHAASLVQDTTTRVLPFASLVGRSHRTLSDPEVQVFLAAADVGGELAYDGALYIWDLRVVEAGAEIMWWALRYGSLNRVQAIQSEAERQFDSAIDAAHRSIWPEREHALAFLAFKRQDALSDPKGAPAALPEEALAAIHAAHERVPRDGPDSCASSTRQPYDGDP